jgi:hypothetical protein
MLTIGAADDELCHYDLDTPFPHPLLAVSVIPYQMVGLFLGAVSGTFYPAVSAPKTAPKALEFS